MRKIEIRQNLDIPLERVWLLFVNLSEYPKYFKYVHKTFFKGDLKLGSQWYDFATFIVPALVKHKITVFEKEKKLGFDVYIPVKGYIKERVTFRKKGVNSTEIKGIIAFDFGNPVFNFLFGGLFERRMRESIQGAVLKVKKEFVNGK